MHRSPLILDYYFVKKTQFELKAGFDEDFNRDLQNVDPPKLKVDVKSDRHSEEPLAWRFEVNIEADEKASKEDFPYIFGVTVVGFFRVDKNYPTENAEMLIKVNAPSVLYSAAREFLANITGRSPYSPILLPSVSFLPSPEEQKKKENKVPNENTKTNRKKKRSLS